MKSVEQQLSEANASIATLTAKLTEATASISTFKKAAVTSEVNAAIAGAKLPEAAAIFVRKQFEGKETSELLKEAVEAVKVLVVAPKVTRNNGSQSVQESAQLDESNRVKRTMKEMRMNEKEARIFLGLD